MKLAIRTLDLSYCVDVAIYMERAERLLQRTANQVARASFFLNHLNGGRVPPVTEADCLNFLALLAERHAAQPAKRPGGRRRRRQEPEERQLRPFDVREAIESAAYGTILKQLSLCDDPETRLAWTWQFLCIWAEYGGYEEPTRRHAEQFILELMYCVRIATAAWPFEVPPPPSPSSN